MKYQFTLSIFKDNKLYQQRIYTFLDYEDAKLEYYKMNIDIKEFASSLYKYKLTEVKTIE